jgi:hypothetical protein
VRRAPTGDAPTRSPFHVLHPLPHAGVTHQLLHPTGDVLLGDDARLIGLGREPDLPDVADVRLVDELVGEVGPGEEGHPVADALHGRVPAAVRDEARDRRVRQHPLLRRPRHHHAAASRADAVEEAVGVAVDAAAAEDDVRAHDPQERPTRELQPQCQLPELARVEHGVAAEGHVHDGPRRLRVEPGHARAVLGPPEMPHHRCRLLATTATATALAREERADWDDPREPREGRRLGVVERVAEDEVALFHRADAGAEVPEQRLLPVVVAYAVPREVRRLHHGHVRGQLERALAQCRPCVIICRCILFITLLLIYIYS